MAGTNERVHGNTYWQWRWIRHAMQGWCWHWFQVAKVVGGCWVGHVVGGKGQVVGQVVGGW